MITYNRDARSHRPERPPTSAARTSSSSRWRSSASTASTGRRPTRSPSKAGVSQPYLFRLFGTKKELYLETVRRCLRQTLEVFQDAGDRQERRGSARRDRQGLCGAAEDRTRLRAQMQAYADCDDEDVREVVRAGYGKLVEYVERVSGAEPGAHSRLLRLRDAAERVRLDGPARPEGALGEEAARGIPAARGMTPRVFLETE